MRAISLFFSFLLMFTLTSTSLYAQVNKDYERALKLYKNKRFSEASEILYRYVQKKPTPSAYYLLGYSLYKLGRHAEAMKYFREAYLLDPEFKPEKIRFK